MIRPLLILAGAAALAACASAPVHYYTLAAPALPAAAAGVPAAFAIDVLPVGIPAGLDQQQLVLRQGAGGVAVQDNERWSGPFGDEVRGALGTALAASLATQNVTGLARAPGAAAQPVLRVQLQVRRFDAWLGDKVQFEGTWRLTFADPARPAQMLCSSRFEVPARGAYPELVQAQQGVLARLATAMATSARGWDGVQARDCAPPTAT